MLLSNHCSDSTEIQFELWTLAFKIFKKTMIFYDVPYFVRYIENVVILPHHSYISVGRILTLWDHLIKVAQNLATSTKDEKLIYLLHWTLDKKPKCSFPV